MQPKPCLLLHLSCAAAALWLGVARADVKSDARQFLETYNATYQRLYTVVNEAQWLALTDVTDEHTGQRIGADQAYSAYLGSPRIIESARALLKQRRKLDALTVRQLERVLLLAAGAPGTIPEVVKTLFAS